MQVDKRVIRGGMVMGLHRVLISQITQHFKPEEGPESQYFSDLCFYMAKRMVETAETDAEEARQTILDRIEI